MMYTYKTLKTRRGMLNNLKESRLISMSISIKHDNVKVNPVYPVANPRYEKDLRILQFSTFNSQEPLNDYLYENPSGFFYQTDIPLEWSIEEGNPLYQYRRFKLGKVSYCIVKIYDQGLIFNLLLGESYNIPYLLRKQDNVTSNEERYNLSELLNLGLLGRITSVMLYDPLTASNFKLPEESTMIALTYNNKYEQGVQNAYELAFFNGTEQPTYSLCFTNWDKLTIAPEKQSVKDWAEGKAFPTVVYTAQYRGKYLSITIKPLLAHQ